MRFTKVFKACLLVGYAFLLVLHFIIKDRFYPLSILFYMLPIPIIIVIGLVISYFIRKKKFVLRIVLGSIFLLVFHWLYAYYGINNSTALEKNNHIFFWNIADQEFLPRPILEETFTTYSPDIIAFVEAKKLSVADLRYLNERLPEYDIRILKGFMFIAVKGEINSTSYVFLKDRSKFNYIETTMNNETVSIVLADVYASPFQNKKSPLNAIYQFSKTNTVDLVFGDFNTPYESIYFKPYKNEFLSFHEVSQGFTATWPIGIPLLELDQIWVSEKFEPISLEKDYSKSSDHAMLLGTFKAISKPKQ